MYITRWEVVWENLPALLAGLLVGLEVAVGSVLVGGMIGLLAAFARTSSNRVLPSLSNTLISLFKDTSLGAAIAVPELTYAGMVLNTNTWRILESWSAIGALYLATCYTLAFMMRRVERQYASWL